MAKYIPAKGKFTSQYFGFYKGGIWQGLRYHKDFPGKPSVEAGSNSEISPRPVPYALREKVKAEILRLEADGILKRVDHSDWGAPIVVPKANGSIRIFGDYKVTVNPNLNLIVDQYPLPLPEDIFATLEGGALFIKLDHSSLPSAGVR